LFAGNSQACDEYIYKGKRWQGRSFRNKYKGMERHPDVVIVKGSSKHRYLMPLDDAMRAQIAPLSKAYPKRAKQAMAEHPSAQRQGSTDPHAPDTQEARHVAKAS
jgi:hypothetical protein